MTKSRIFVAALLFGVILAAGACTQNQKFTGPSDLDAPVVSSFTLSPTFGPAGTTTTLAWTVTGQNVRVAIVASAGTNPGNSFAGTGSTTASPQTDTTYFLEATNTVTGAKVNASQFFDVR